MGTELMADIWVATLAAQQGRPGAAARVLLRTQVLTFNRTGHMLAFNDELPRRRIQQAVARSGLPRIYVRCLRCGCTAWLQEWIKAAPLIMAARNSEADRLDPGRLRERVQYLRACPSTNYLAYLESLTTEPEEEKP